MLGGLNNITYICQRLKNHLIDRSEIIKVFTIYSHTSFVPDVLHFKFDK